MDASRHDAWQAADAYDVYMGRWSRLLAPRFLSWFGAPGAIDWLEIGCGTGALSAAILERANPRDLVAFDLSEAFVERARATVGDPRATFRVGDAQALPLEDASRDAAVSGLVLNFVPDRERALGEMRRALRPGGKVGFYVWDYPGGGLEFLRHFWRVAAELDPEAAPLAEARRFPYCTQDGLVALAERGGLRSVDHAAIEIETVFTSFADYWQPFTLGAGPAPGYVATLSQAARERLRQQLEASLPISGDGALRLKARAWAIRGVAG